MTDTPQLASVDGAVTAAAEARIPIDDHGLLRGDGVFEVVRLYAGAPYALEEHLERMARSAHGLRLPFDASLVREDALRLLGAAAPADGALRLVWTRGGRRLALLEPLPPFPEAAALRSVTYAPTRVLDGIKSLSYGANRLCSRLAQEQGADEALMVTPHGRVLEAPTSSFFLVADGQLCTPPLEDHVLDSITRRRVLEVADVVQRPITLDEACRADEAFLASTLKEVLPVRAIDDAALSAPGPVSRDVAQRVGDRIARELAAG